MSEFQFSPTPDCGERSRTLEEVRQRTPLTGLFAVADDSGDELAEHFNAMLAIRVPRQVTPYDGPTYQAYELGEGITFPKNGAP